MFKQEMIEEFKTLAKSIERKGIEKVLEYLEDKTDFFTAPASTKYHGCYKGGLVEHSLNVYKQLREESKNETQIKKTLYDSILIMSLFHDICKANYYKESTRNTKVNGEWIQVPFYEVDDKIPLGHGEKSVMILQRFISLSSEEMIAIRWHMGAFDNAIKGGDYSLSAVYNKYPVALLLHIADMKATYFIEGGVDKDGKD